MLALEEDLLFSLFPDEPEDFVSDEEDDEDDDPEEEESLDEELDEESEDDEADEPSPLPPLAAGVLLDDELRLSLR